MGEIDVDDGRPRAVVAAQGLERLLRPGFGGRLVVEVAVDARRRTLGPQLRQPVVDAAAHLAESGIGAVAERQHREAQPVEPRCIAGEQRFVEGGGTLRRLTFAPGAGDHHQRARILQRPEVGVRHVDQPCGEAGPAGGALRRVGYRFRIARLGAVENRERLPCRRRRGVRRRRPSGRLQAGQEAAQPAALFRVRPGDDAVQRIDLVGGEGRARGEEGDGGHASSF